MEKGKLSIQATKKGFAGKIIFTKPSGKPGQLPISVIKFKDTKLNGKECEFERDAGKLSKLVVEGQVLYPIGGIPQKNKTQKGQKPHNQKQTQGSPEVLEDSVQIKSTFLPQDTQDVLLYANYTGIENFMLKFHKAARYDTRREVFTFFKKERKGESYQIQTNYDQFPFAKLAQRHYRNAKTQSLNQKLIDTTLSIDWRLALGLGLDNVYETGITLHHTYGIPYIPASSLKGVVRSWIITHFFATHQANEQPREFDLKEAEKRALKNQTFCDFFGSDDKGFYAKATQGKLIFFDAFSYFNTLH